jgi:beta-glucanase (GH16 family)
MSMSNRPAPTPVSALAVCLLPLGWAGCAPEAPGPHRSEDSSTELPAATPSTSPTVDTEPTAKGPCDGLPDEVFCDDFVGDSLDLDRWWYGRRHWGPAPPRCHGVIPENVSVSDGLVRFAALGDTYSGPLFGMRKSGGYHQDQPATRSGGMIVSDAFFGSGSYEFRMRLPSQVGAASAAWTLHYQEIYEGEPGYDGYVAEGNIPRGSAADGFYVVVNHEIDIETPTALDGVPDTDASHANARYNIWIGESDAEHTPLFIHQGADLADGAFHTWRFDWHTGTTSLQPSVIFLVDEVVLAYVEGPHVPTIAGRLYLGIWFAEWAGSEAPFDQEWLEVDWVRITPLNEPGDRFEAESYPDDGMTKCRDKADNDSDKPECELAD